MLYVAESTSAFWSTLVSEMQEHFFFLKIRRLLNKSAPTTVLERDRTWSALQEQHALKQQLNKLTRAALWIINKMWY